MVTTVYSPELAAEYAELWATMEIKRVRLAEITAVAAKISAGRDRYTPVEARTGVPWWFIGILHLRESNCNFNAHLHNGDPLTGRTYHVPAGRPLHGSPPFSFEDSAVDALAQKGYDKVKDWSIPHVCYMAERYNGFGYRDYHATRSPYLWGGTNHQQCGKYIDDGVYSSTTWDTQPGVIAALKLILAGESAGLPPPPPPPPALAPRPGSARPTLMEGSRGGEVEALQRMLNTAGIMVGVDGIFGTQTYFAVLKFQASRGIVADGIVGPMTWKELEDG